MYYEMDPKDDPEITEAAIILGDSFEKLEPEIFERIVAITYFIFGEENLWVARIWGIIFWFVGGIFLFDLSRRIASINGAFISLAFYMVLPFSVVVSRSFLPDVPMTMFVILSAYSLYRWVEARSWRLTFLAGLFSGLAILFKVFAVFPVFFVAFLLVLSNMKLKVALKNPQVWVVGLISVILPSSYYLVQTLDRAGGYLSDWVFAFTHLLVTPGFYIRWAQMLDYNFGLLFITLGLVGVTIAQGRGRIMLTGLWLGYIFIGISVPSLITSHTYYNTVLIPITAISLAPIADLLLVRISKLPLRWKILLLPIGLVALGYPAITARNQLLARNYREEIKGWVKMGEELPVNARIIGMTHDYNTRLKYYGWVAVAQWPHFSDFEMHILAGGNYDPGDESIINDFMRRTEGFEYFIVSAMNELDAQTMLKSILYENYPSTTGEGYILFDLRALDHDQP
jgi:4-amino-4-deoxy-L-arabinose transferase-like glycosyltransferase